MIQQPKQVKPASVTGNSLKYFKQVLWDGLTQEMLNIGPFPSQEEAEKSKLIYRGEER